MKKYLTLIILTMIAAVTVSCSKPTEQLPEEEVGNEEVADVEDTEDGEDLEDEDLEVGIYPAMLAPDFVAEDRDGNEIKLSDYKGKIRFLNFWATTCPHCVNEMPDLEEFYNNHKDEDDFALIGINMTRTWEKMSKEEIVSWADDIGITFPMAFDLDGKIASEWPSQSLPVTFIVDEKGVSHGAIMGRTDVKTLEGVLEDLRGK